MRTLTDLDELLLEVRDRTSRTYIEEAIAAYRGGALRPAVVATWVAVATDIINKLRELGNQGDAAAIAEVTKIDAAIANSDRTAMQKIEGGLLEIAKAPFEFLGDREYVDLERLRVDRHQCAHPAFVRSGSLFVPSAELVRTHIVYSIEHLLRHPPVQGKAALDRLLQDLQHPSFPRERDQVIKYFKAKYLANAKTSLIESFVAVFLKDILLHAQPVLIPMHPVIAHCLESIAQSHQAIYESVLAKRLPALIDHADDAVLVRVMRLVGTDPSVWSRLSEPVRIRLAEIIKNAKTESVENFPGAPPWETTTVYPDAALLNGFAVPELAPHVANLFKRLPSQVQSEYITAHPHPNVCSPAIEEFASASGWRVAESLTRNLLLPLAPIVEPKDIKAALLAAADNGQIWDAAEVPSLLAEFFEKTARHHSPCKADWVAFLTKMDRNVRKYSDLRDRMVAAGMIPAPPAEPKEEL